MSKQPILLPGLNAHEAAMDAYNPMIRFFNQNEWGHFALTWTTKQSCHSSSSDYTVPVWTKQTQICLTPFPS